MRSNVDSHVAWSLRRETDKFTMDLVSWDFLRRTNRDALDTLRAGDMLDGAAERMEVIMSKLDFPFVMKLTAGADDVTLQPPEVIENGSRQPHWGELLPAWTSIELDCLTRMYDTMDAGIDSRIGSVGLGYLTLPTLAGVLANRGTLTIINTQI